MHPPPAAPLFLHCCLYFHFFRFLVVLGLELRALLGRTRLESETQGESLTSYVIFICLTISVSIPSSEKRTISISLASWRMKYAKKIGN
jgi:hypothetical protein